MIKSVCLQLSVFVFSLLGALLPVSADDPSAIVRFSDGEIVSGPIKIVWSRPLTLVPKGENRQRFFRLEDLVSIGQEVETARMAKPWTFKESGRPEKVFSEDAYPLVNFRTRLTLVNGEVVEGHLISAALALRTGEGRRKLFLKRQIKGKRGEKLEGLLYPEVIRFPNAAVSEKRGIRGKIRGWGRVEAVSALDLEREQVLFARVGEEGDFDFGALLPGSYTLCALTDTHVLAGLTGEGGSPPGGTPLESGDQGNLGETFKRADDFFRDRWVLHLAGVREKAWALVYKRRANYYHAERITPGGFVWHLESWLWHLAGAEWKLDRRQILIRHKQQAREKTRKLYHLPAFDAVPAGSDLGVIEGNRNEKKGFIRDLG